MAAVWVAGGHPQLLGERWCRASGWGQLVAAGKPFVLVMVCLCGDFGVLMFLRHLIYRRLWCVFRRVRLKQLWCWKESVAA
ncbi:MAG: hypothetical protein A2461_08490 [Burkholderiales bacterium RIFOXYC2_FULL_59_8]|nr:MAG: hypothetical protein A2461_08490 [Burkholderiales bacterium RIFOXYC2_FULL_59_8]